MDSTDSIAVVLVLVGEDSDTSADSEYTDGIVHSDDFAYDSSYVVGPDDSTATVKPVDSTGTVKPAYSTSAVGSADSTALVDSEDLTAFVHFEDLTAIVDSSDSGNFVETAYSTAAVLSADLTEAVGSADSTAVFVSEDYVYTVNLFIRFLVLVATSFYVPLFSRTLSVVCASETLASLSLPGGYIS